jgi:hypothetical protein
MSSPIVPKSLKEGQGNKGKKRAESKGSKTDSHPDTPYLDTAQRVMFTAAVTTTTLDGSKCSYGKPSGRRRVVWLW